MPATSCRMEHGGWGISRRAAKAEPRVAGSASPHRDLARAGGGHWLDVAHGLGSLLDGGEPLASHRGFPAAQWGWASAGDKHFESPPRHTFRRYARLAVAVKLCCRCRSSLRAVTFSLPASVLSIDSSVIIPLSRSSAGQSRRFVRPSGHRVPASPRVLTCSWAARTQCEPSNTFSRNNA